MWIYEKSLYLPLKNIEPDEKNALNLCRPLGALEIYTKKALNARYATQDPRAKALLTDIATECLNLQEVLWALLLAMGASGTIPCRENLLTAYEKALEQTDHPQAREVLQLLKQRALEHEKYLAELDIVL